MIIVKRSVVLLKELSKLIVEPWTCVGKRIYDHMANHAGSVQQRLLIWNGGVWIEIEGSTRMSTAEGQRFRGSFSQDFGS